MKLHFFFLSFFLVGCTTPQFYTSNNKESQVLLEEMRQEVADVKHSLKSTQVSVQILEEKFQDQDQSLSTLKYQATQKNPKSEQLSFEMNNLEQRVEYLEKLRDKIDQALQKIQECEHELAHQKLYLEDVGQLKSTLTSISHAMHQNKSPSIKKHRVKPGETLEKIAKQYRTTVFALKKINHLTDDRILIGSDIEIPHE
jgi:LysM repeat protein